MNTYEIISKEKGRGKVSKSLVVTYPDGAKYNFTRYKTRNFSHKHAIHSIFRCSKYKNFSCAAKVIQKHLDGDEEDDEEGKSEFIHFHEHTCKKSFHSKVIKFEGNEKKESKENKIIQHNQNTKKRKQSNSIRSQLEPVNKKRKIVDEKRVDFHADFQIPNYYQSQPLPLRNRYYDNYPNYGYPIYQAQNPRKVDNSEKNEVVVKKEPDLNEDKVQTRPIQSFPSYGDKWGDQYIELYFSLVSNNAKELNKEHVFNPLSGKFQVFFGKSMANVILIKPTGIHNNELFKNTAFYEWENVKENSQFMVLVQTPPHSPGLVDVSIFYDGIMGVLNDGFEYIDYSKIRMNNNQKKLPIENESPNIKTNENNENHFSSILQSNSVSRYNDKNGYKTNNSNFFSTLEGNLNFTYDPFKRESPITPNFAGTPTFGNYLSSFNEDIKFS